MAALQSAGGQRRPYGRDRSTADRTLEGSNDWKRTDYGDPCPPIGRHRYSHKLYVLDVVLSNLNQPNKTALEKAMQAHILAQAELIGLCQRH